MKGSAEKYRNINYDFCKNNDMIETSDGGQRG